jgi:hypothetical protein
MHISLLDVEIDLKDITRKGTEAAEAAGGKLAAYAIALEKFYLSFIMKIQESRKKISDFKEEINVLEQKKMDVNNHPDKYEMKINSSDKIKFYILLIILISIALYLYVFYNSVLYSAVFKNFLEGIHQNGVTNVFFDPNALSNSFKLGFSALIIMLLFPFIFYIPPILSYMINANKNASHRKIKLFALMFGTLVFDTFLAYGITKKMHYAIEYNANPDSISLYDLSIAITMPDFWLIIGIGFGICVCCGFMFSIFISAWENLHPLSLMLKGIDSEIKSKFKAIDEIRIGIGRIEVKDNLIIQGIVNDLNAIQKLQAFLNENSAVQISLAQLKLIIYSFLEGWVNFVNSINSSQEDKEQPGIITKQFFNNIEQSCEKEQKINL